MTIQGAICELNNMLSSNDIPCYWKPVIKKIIETIEQTEQNVGEMSEKQTDGDLISRQDAIDVIQSVDNGENHIDELTTNVIGYIEQLPSAEKTDEWCHGCKEYDNEKHCCPRFNKVIRDTVNEMKAQTDGDLISRQAVLDIFGDIHPLDYNARAYVAQINELPSAEKTEKYDKENYEIVDLGNGLYEKRRKRKSEAEE